MDKYEIRPVAKIHTDFGEKFGIPRQSGLVPELRGRVVFEPEFRNYDVIKELDKYSHIWLIFGFSKIRDGQKEGEADFSPLVKPPRLGGKTKVGVFASRSPYRPNSLGLSAVELIGIEKGEDGPCLIVGGADLLNGTPIYDIKPYVPYSDAIPDAEGGFSVSRQTFLNVDFPESLLVKVPEEKRTALTLVLSQDPRGAYEKQPGFVYGLNFSGMDIRFTVENDTVKVFEVISAGDDKKHIK